jgi:epoxyqueuosine reductase
MDASRCISYLTIEHRGDISRPFQEMMGDWLFGCDICQQVCPFNREAPLAGEPAFAIRTSTATISPDEVLRWAPDDYAERLAGSAMKRATLPMLRRNAEIVRQNLARRDSASI